MMGKKIGKKKKQSKLNGKWNQGNMGRRKKKTGW